MAQIEVLLPKMGESVAEATITTWLKKEGDKIEAEESLVEIATDKVDSEVPAPADGVVLKILVQEGEVAQVGQPIAIIGAEGEQPADSAAPAPAAESTAAVQQVEETVQAGIATASTTIESNSDRFYSPLVKSIALKEGIAQNELDKIAGTGKEGRVTKADILAYVENRGTVTPQVVAPAKAVTSSAPATPANSLPSTGAAANFTGNNVEIIEMDRMRKLIADHMVKSKHVSPHVTSFVEADVTNIVRWRERVKKKFQEREGEKITFTPIFMEAVVKAIKDFPMINIELDGDKIIRKKFINVGMATALPSGNLIVPVIKNADQLSLVGLTKSVNDLANRARVNQLKPDEISGGTYTITNVGTFGNVMGTPIINQPQVAILALGAIRKKPAVIETPEGDMIAIRHMMFLSHSYDHRVVDGSLGGQFVRRVADYLEGFDPNREF